MYICTMTPPPIPVAIFVRVSKQAQDYERQIADLKHCAERQVYSIVTTIAEKISGIKRNDERRGVVELLALVTSGRIKKVLVTEVSRLGRRTSDVLAIIEELTEHGVSVYLHNYNLETLTPQGKRNPVASLLCTLLTEFFRLEKETLIERIHSGLDNARRKGKTLGRPHGTTKEDAALVKEYSAVVRCLKQDFPLKQTAKPAGVSVNTVRKVKKAIQTSCIVCLFRHSKPFINSYDDPRFKHSL
jgi:DNA invertase Pin-like site-specific DNA recombinase